MILEAVTVCVNYGDFLAQTLPHNLPHFDRWVVVTSPADKETIAVCKKYGVSHVEADYHKEDAEQFNKGRLINLGLSHLRHNGWILHVDADIALPGRLRYMLGLARLQLDCIYGADRFNCYNFAAWQKQKDSQEPLWQHHFLLRVPPAYEFGARLIHWDYGYCPIGYFQLWHNSANKTYPVSSGGAEHSDVVFAANWPRAKRILLPEVTCFHLDSERNALGLNWGGRKSRPFKPERPYTKV